ncbi:MAG TPA: hypothetical protein VLA72_02385, partial [Anaerolineales bacterium]|nr:hypothetical protein [Anaerolineales bacterium]
YVDTNVNFLSNSNKKLWFILDSETIWTNGETKVWVESNAELVDVWYLRRPENNFISVYIFDPNQIERHE